jgi:hypothetical protein
MFLKFFKLLKRCPLFAKTALCILNIYLINLILGFFLVIESYSEYRNAIFIT